jgi:NAD(P)-dependent dehydrogenase (short-subunit alcohol dehydrogenase family)
MTPTGQQKPLESKVWFVTGSSRGFGREFVKAAAARGDRVAATARNIESVDDLVSVHGDAILPLALDITDRTAVAETVRRAHDYFGRLDVVVNNAGQILHGAVEEINDDEFRNHLEVNLFGPLWVAQSVLPFLRRQASGHIVQISSLAGVAAYPTLGAYHASKWALEGLSEALAGEVGQFGIKVTIVEPGSFATTLYSGLTRSTPLAEYDPLREALVAGHPADTLGDPAAAARALLKIVDAENPPLRVIFGTHPSHAAEQIYAERLKTWAEWSEVSAEAQGDSFKELR